MSSSRLNSTLPLKACECRGLKCTDLGCGLGGLEAPGLEEQDKATNQTFAAPLLRLEPQWKDDQLPFSWGFSSVR